MAIQVTDSNFEEQVIQSDKPVLADLWAEWCGPCKMIHPILDELEKEYEGKITIASLDVDNNPQIPAKYRVRNIPTILFFKNGEIIDKQVGVVPKNTIANKIDQLL